MPQEISLDEAYGQEIGLDEAYKTQQEKTVSLDEAYKVPPQKKGGLFRELAKGAAWDVKQIGAIGESIARTAGGIAGFIPGLVTTLGSRIAGQSPTKARETGGKVSEFISGGPTPLLPETQTYQSILGSPFAAVGKGFEKAAEITSGADVQAQADAMTALELASIFAPALVKGKGFKAAKRESLYKTAEEARAEPIPQTVGGPVKGAEVKPTPTDKGATFRKEIEAEKASMSPELYKSYQDWAVNKIERGMAETLEREEGIPKEQTLAKLATERMKEEAATKPTSPEVIKNKPAWEMTKNEFVSAFNKYKNLTDAGETRVERKFGQLTPKRLEELSKEKDWKEWSRKRGYTEKEISDHETWMKLSDAGLGLDYPIDDPVFLHHEAVRRAVDSGQKVSSNVLADYPDLQTSQTVGKSPLIAGAVRGGSVLPGMPLPKRVGPINLDRMGMDYPATKLMADVEDAIHLARAKGQPKETWSESQAKADAIGGAYEIGQAIGKSAEEVISDYSKSTKDLAAKVDAVRAIVRTSGERLHGLAKAYSDNPTEANLNNFQLAFADHAAIQYASGGGSSNIARAMNIHKKTARAKEFLMSGLQKKFLQEMGKDTLDPEAIKLLATFDPKNPVPIIRYLSQAKQATTRQKIFEVWMNSILSNPLTHIINTTSNVATEMLSMVETAGGAAVAAIEHPKNVSARSVYFGDAAYQALGAMHGMKEAIRRVGYAWKAGMPESAISKLEIPTKAIKGKKGEIIRTPTKLLMVEDEAMKGIIYTDSIYSQAYHMATKEGLRGAERKNRITKLVSEPTEKMIAEANHQATYKTFQKELGNFGKSLMHLRQSGPGSEFLFPFVRTPINIAKYGLERSPLRTVTLPHEIISGKLTGAAREKAIFTTAASVAATVTLANFVMDGKITGAGPTDTNARQSLYRTGWQPYSMKIGDKYYSYSRIEPFATILGTLADFWEINKSMEKESKAKVAAQIGVSVKNNIMNKTFMTGLADILNAIDDPARYGESWLQRLAGSAIPSGVAGVARAIDPNLREAKSVIDTIKSRIPVVSQTLPPKLTPTGEPIERPGGVVSRMFSPVAVSRKKEDLVWNELNRLQINMGLPRPTIGGKKAEPEDIREIIKAGGPDMKKALNDFISAPYYSKIPDDMKVKYLKSIITRYRKFGTTKYKMEKK